ncbi:transposase [Streptomyces rishiriensis]
MFVVWDNLNTHRTAGLRDYAAAQGWLTIIQLPSHSPDLNPVEGVWSLFTARLDGQHRMHRPRPPHPHPPSRPCLHPAPPATHRRLPHRNRPDLSPRS